MSPDQTISNQGVVPVCLVLDEPRILGVCSDSEKNGYIFKNYNVKSFEVLY